MSTASRPPLTDSPWFWLYVFATAGVLALLASSTKFGARQSQLDRQFEGRRHAATLSADEQAARPFSSPVARIQSLRPLYVLMTVAIVAGWVVLWWQRFRPAARSEFPAQPVDAQVDDSPLVPPRAAHSSTPWSPSNSPSNSSPQSPP